MELTEQQVYTALGLTAGNEQESGEPAASEETVEAQESEQPDEATVASDGPEKAEDTSENGAGEDDAAPAADTRGTEAGQSPEERRENAARRRRAEQQEAIDRAVEQARQEERDAAQKNLSEFFSTANLKNTITGAPITTMDEFREWKSAYDAAKLQKDLKAGKLTPEALDVAISANPTVKRAEEIIRQNEEARRAQERQAAQARVDADIQEIHKLDPSINSVQDLINMPNSKEFYSLVKRGNSFLDAYRLANFDKLTAARAEQARQQAMNNARSKDHLRPTTGQQGTGAVSVPADEMAMFRAINPGATEAQIQAYYNKIKH